MGLESRLNEIARQAENIKLRVGFFSNAKYDDGEYVANVAFENEYGSATNPIRPFFRQMTAAKKSGWGVTLAGFYDGDINKNMSELGEVIKNQLKESIVNYNGPNPHNSAATIAKKGFDAPLRDSMTMARSTAYTLDQ